MSLYASIDLGSNTVRLLVAAVEQGKLVPQLCCRQVTRLGGGFDPEVGLAPAAMERTLAALETFAGQLAAANPDKLRVAGTEVLRRAANADAFLATVRNRTGFEVEVLSGEEEARLSALGVLAALDPRPEQALIFDIGGGSTELALVDASGLRWQQSFPLGVVRLCEQYANDDERQNAIDATLVRMGAEIAAAVLVDQVMAGETALVGTAGTVTTLAAILLQLAEYRGELVSNIRITAAQLAELRATLLPMSLAQRSMVIGLESGREDLIIPGIDVVNGLLRLVQKKVLTVSDSGLLEGLIIDQIKR